MKCTPLARRTFCPYHTIVQFNDAFTDCQSQPKSVYFPYEPSIDPTRLHLERVVSRGQGHRRQGGIGSSRHTSISWKSACNSCWDTSSVSLE